MLSRVRRLRPAGFIAGFLAAIVLTGGGAAAYAANGGSLIIGRSNYGTATTKLTNTRGTPLKLTAKAGYAPLAVNSTRNVTNLSADRLDGLSSGSFALAGGQTGKIAGDSDWFDANDDGIAEPADGVIISWADCPTGTKLTGGGNENYTSGYTFVDVPDGSSWVVLTDTDPDATEPDVPSDLTAYAVCYNPRGAVPGAAMRSAEPSVALSPALMDRVTKAAARHSR